MKIVVSTGHPMVEKAKASGKGELTRTKKDQITGQLGSQKKKKKKKVKITSRRMGRKIKQTNWTKTKKKKEKNQTYTYLGKLNQDEL